MCTIMQHVCTHMQCTQGLLKSTACTVVFLYYFTPWVVCVGGEGRVCGRGEGEGEGCVAEGQLHRRYPEMPNVTELNRQSTHIRMSLSDT